MAKQVVIISRNSLEFRPTVVWEKIGKKPLSEKTKIKNLSLDTGKIIQNRSKPPPAIAANTVEKRIRPEVEITHRHPQRATANFGIEIPRK